MFYKLRWLREIGIFLLTVSILYLPFFYQPGPDELIMGKSFLAFDRSLDQASEIKVAFGCFWLVYLLSHTLSEKWSFLMLLPFAVAIYFYLITSFGYTMKSFFEYSNPSNWEYYAYHVDIGIGLSGCGAWLLLMGVYVTQTNLSPFRWGVVGGLGGFVLFALPSLLYLFLEDSGFFLVHALLCLTLPPIGMIIGVVFRVAYVAPQRPRTTRPAHK